MHFIENIDSIRSPFNSSQTLVGASKSRRFVEPTSSPSIGYASPFNKIALETLLKTVNNIKSSTSPLNIWPTSFLKEVVPSIGPHILSIVNSSFPPILKLLWSLPIYADNTRLYLPIKLNNNTNLQTLHNFLSDIKSWMSIFFSSMTPNLRSSSLPLSMSGLRVITTSLVHWLPIWSCRQEILV